MKKPLILGFCLLLLLTGCSEVTKSRNTSTDMTEITEEAKPIENNEVTSPEPVSEANNKEFAAEDSLGKDLVYENIDDQLPSNQEEMSLEDIIIKMKGIFPIKDSYDDVTTQENNPEVGVSSYNVNYFETATGDSAWFQSDIYGNLMGFGTYSQEDYSQNIEINFSLSEGEEKVRDLLGKLYGEIGQEFIILNNSRNNSIEQPTYFFNAYRTFNGIPLADDFLTIELNKKNGKINSVYIQTTTNYNFADTSYFEDSEKVVTKEEALQAFWEINSLYKGLLKLENNYYGRSNQPIEYIPIYSFLDEQIPINAKTLKGVFSYPRIETYDAFATEEAAKGEGLSEFEQEQIDKVNEQNSAKDAEAKARKLFGLEDYRLVSSNLSNFMGMKDYYVWNLNFVNNDKYVFVSFLASDLSLLNYNGPYSYGSSSPSEENTKAYIEKANKILKEIGGQNLDGYTLTERSKNYQSGPIHNLEYVRKYDDLHIYTERVIISIKKENNELASYNKNWIAEENINVPDFILSKEESFDKLLENYTFDLVYKRTNGGQKPVVLVYKLENLSLESKSYIVDARNGQIIDSVGQAINPVGNIDYEDIDQAKNPEIIEFLKNNGIGYYNENLNPTEGVTQISLFRLLASSILYGRGVNASEDEIYQALESYNILDGQGREPEKIITQRDYARYISRYLGYQEFASLNSIYKDRFDDISSGDSDYGYLVLAKEKGLIESSSENLLEPEKVIDRENALYYYYNLKLNN